MTNHTIHLDRLSINYGVNPIFTDLSWTLKGSGCFALVGGNGAGKSTLLKLIAKDIIPDSGHLHISKGARIGYLPQDVAFPPDKTVYDLASQLPPHLAELDAQLARIEQQLSDPDVYGDTDRLTKTLNRQETLLEAFDEAGGAQHEGRVRELLNLLGFEEHHDSLPAEVLSGGQKKLLGLIQLALNSPHFLLLDEPDNHLDMGAKHQLERFIHQYEGLIVIVSHDRYLLDEVANQVIELNNGRLTTYHGNYTHYSTERELAQLRQQQAYVAQQKEIARIEAAIKRFELWASLVVDERHIKQANSRRKMLERMEANGEIIEEVQALKTINLNLQGKRGSRKALEVCDLAMAFDDDFLFLDLNFVVRHGERVGLVGENGAGKSVLFQLILGNLAPVDGEVRIGNSTEIGYYAQQHETLSAWLARTPMELFRDAAPKREETIVAFLLQFLFTYDQLSQPIHTLSGGERSRLQLALLMLQNPNLLLLDEPTNNLDIPSVEVLEKTLETFEGAVFVISHDRYFLDAVVDVIFELKDGAIYRYEGNYTDYIERRSVTI